MIDWALRAFPSNSFVRPVAFAGSRPDDMDIDGVMFRPKRQAL